jgi:hypothetical protein
MDLQGVTVAVNPPARPEEGKGYFEYIEGSPTDLPAIDTTNGGSPDSTVGQRGDILMFTTRNPSRPFIGRFGTGTLQSDVAEVAWFLRGHNLHRRVLLVAPWMSTQLGNTSSSSFFAMADISVRKANNQIFCNNLADLTKRENRFAHPADQAPFDARRWKLLGLPTLRECSSPTWMAGWTTGTTPPPAATPSNAQSVDLWVDSTNGKWPDDKYMAPSDDGTRPADDVVLTNVIGFDVKIWDPGVGGYVDLGYENTSYVAPTTTPAKRFNHLGTQVGPPQSQLVAGQKEARVYDTWSFGYETEGTNFSNGNGPADAVPTPITMAPYPAPARGIQVKVRVFEPDSREVREVTIEQDFLPK